MRVRPLNEKDMEQVEALDEKSGDYVAQWLDCEDYAYGMFVDDKLIGYCTIGGADDVPDCIEKHRAYSDGHSLLLSDVYILPKYRHKLYGYMMVDNALFIRLEKEKGVKSVYLTLLYDELSNFYGKLGFKWVDETEQYAMVKEVA